MVTWAICAVICGVIWRKLKCCPSPHRASSSSFLHLGSAPAHLDASSVRRPLRCCFVLTSFRCLSAFVPAFKRSVCVFYALVEGKCPSSCIVRHLVEDHARRRLCCSSDLRGGYETRQIVVLGWSTAPTSSDSFPAKSVTPFNSGQ